MEDARLNMITLIEQICSSSDYFDLYLGDAQFKCYWGTAYPDCGSALLSSVPPV